MLKLYKIIIIFPTETVKDLGFDGPSFAFPDMDGKIFFKTFLFSFYLPKHFPNH